MTYSALPGRQVSMTSSRLNAQLSLPTSNRLTVMTCGAANALLAQVRSKRESSVFFICYLTLSEGFPGREQADGRQYQRAQHHLCLCHPDKNLLFPPGFRAKAWHKKIPIRQRNCHHHHDQRTFEQQQLDIRRLPRHVYANNKERIDYPR